MLGAGKLTWSRLAGPLPPGGNSSNLSLPNPHPISPSGVTQTGSTLPTAAVLQEKAAQKWVCTHLREWPGPYPKDS